MPSHKTFRGCGLKLTLDRKEIDLDDPGTGTPAMVEHQKSGKTGTYWCCLETGEVDGIELTENQKQWLADREFDVDDFLYGPD